MKEVWDKERPKDLGKPKKLSPMQKAAAKAMAKKAVGMHESQLHGGKKSNLTKLAKGGSASSRADGCAVKGKTKGTMVRMAAGGSVSSRADGIAQRGKTRA